MTKLILFLSLFSVSLFAPSKRLCAQDFTFDKDKGQAVPNFLCQLKLMKGKVYKKSGNDLVEVKLGERFVKSDTIVTSEQSIAKVLVVDDTIITIGPSSELSFENFEFMDKTNRKAVYNLIKGQLSGNVKNKAKDGDLQFKTKYTVLGVRGTEILMNFRTVNAIDVSEYALLSGKAEITDDKGGKHDITKGEHVVFLHDTGTKKSAIEKLKLSNDDQKNLKALKIDETKDFKPLMPYYKAEDVVMNSTEASVTGESTTAEEKRVDKKPWQENLKELNQKLKENNKKR